MLRVVLSIVLVSYCGLAAAEQIKPRATVKTVATAKPVKPSKPAKKPVPKGPPAKELFASAATPAPLAARSIGGYAKGCLSGGVALPINGPNWQVMRLSRNRNWGNPRLLDYLEKLSSDARALDGWPGLLIGDMSQPRGGPMINGHTSHQIGLDADVWLTPMPDRILSNEEREDMIAVSMLKDPFTVDADKFTLMQAKLIRRAASYPQVARIFVHPAIKKALCEMAPKMGGNQAWLAKVRPWWNHYYHFHIRLACAPGAEACENQAPVNGDDGCGEELKNWYAMLKKSAIWRAELQQAKPKPEPPSAKPAKPAPGKPPLHMTDLPKECQSVLAAGGDVPVITADTGLPPIALKALASKDAGPPLPRLTQDQLQILLAGGDLTASMPLPDRNPRRGSAIAGN